MRINGETHRRHSVSLSADSFLVSTNESHTLAKNVANLVAIQPSISLEAADRSSKSSKKDFSSTRDTKYRN